MLDVRLLGPFQARRPDGVVIKPPGRRSLALLTCLAVKESCWNRNEMATLLWPGRDPAQARASLRQELLRLREAFGPVLQAAASVPGTIPPLDHSQVAVDIWRFREAAADRTRILEAIAIYRGELVQDFNWPEHAPLTAWLTRRRAELRTLIIDCLRDLLRSNRGSEQLARRLAELAPDCEEACLWLLHYYADIGSPSRATECYQAHATALKAVGREPSGALQTLLAQSLARRRSPSKQATKPTADWIRAVRSKPKRIARPDAASLPMVSERPSLVVLPFADISGGSPGTTLADGITEEVTSALALMPGFFVCARHSAMAYKSTAADVRSIAAELGVRYAVEGSVVQRNGGIRINARLIDCTTGLHVWADRQDARARDILDVRDELVQAMAARLQPSLINSEIRLALQRRTDQLDAWGWLQRALGALLHLDDRYQSLTRALDALQHAIERDPAYAMAHALLSAVYTWRTLTYAFPDPDGDRKLARQHSDKALRIEPENPFVLVHCAETAIYSSARIDDARAMLEAAVNRNPNDAHCLALLGNTRRFAGDDARTSLALIDQAIRLSPRDPRSFSWLHYGSWCHWKLGELEDMEDMSRRSVELYPGYPHSWIALTCALGLQNKDEAAREAGRTLRSLHPRFGAASFYQTAERFYGRRFPGRISAEYAELCAVLSRATDD